MFSPQLWQAPTADNNAFEQLPRLKKELENHLAFISKHYKAVRFASSLAVEDMVITEVISRLNLPIKVFTLDTGKLHQETLQLLNQTREHFPNLTIETFEPLSDAVVAFDNEHGISSIYDSLEQRKLCCSIRKLEPLNRALKDADAWITGQRREQSSTRTALPFEERDELRGITKFNPLYAWDEATVWAYIKSYDLPINKLYENGYPSIGCEPCTRPIRINEEIRAGRWWWEHKNSKECGLHQAPNNEQS